VIRGDGIGVGVALARTLGAIVGTTGVPPTVGSFGIMPEP
jgi:hypothetical protein